MHKLVFFVFFFVLGSRFCSGAIFEDLNHVYSIDFPNNWIIEEKNAKQIAWVIAFSPEKKESSLQITYNEKSSQITLNEYVPEMIRYMKENYADIQLEEIESTKVAGLDAKSILFTASGPTKSGKNNPLKAIHYLFVADQHLMIILCVAPEDRFDVLKPTFDKAISSLHFFEKTE